jgi:hypothetical protein
MEDVHVQFSPQLSSLTNVDQLGCLIGQHITLGTAAVRQDRTPATETPRQKSTVLPNQRTSSSPLHT